jgi:phage major head subunit gpT-like protein
MDWSAQHVLSLEDELKVIQMNEYELALQNLWWDKLMSKRPIGGRQETWEFMLATASIKHLDPGEMKYDSMVRGSLRLESGDMGDGLRVSRNQFEDDKISFAADWASQIGADMALVPQRQAVALLLAGETGLGYDGVAFFSNSHPTNVAAGASGGTYDNLLETNPLVDVDGKVIPANYNTAEARLRSFTMPSGQNRGLAPTLMVVGPALKLAAQTITGAQFIDATNNPAAGGIGTFNGQINTGIGLVVVNEITDLSWYLIAGNAGTQLLPLIYGERKPYTMTSYDGISDAELGRLNQVEWQVRGRNVAIYGHPFQAVKSKP